MSEYSDEHAEIAISILSRAHDELIERGFGEVEACHALVHAGLDWLPEYCCPAHLAEEYGAIAEASRTGSMGSPRRSWPRNTFIDGPLA